MAVHLNRDYLVQNANVARSATSYVLAIFLRRVLGYAVVGQTNFDIESVGTLLIASGTGVGQKAGINHGFGTYVVSIPVGARTVIGGDAGRILVLRSTANPRFNSGCFAITSVDTVNNRYTINWRSGDAPPPEAADSMEWWLYAADSLAPSINVSGAQNGGPGYNGNGSSTTPRIILQSPHATGWQLRICHETLTEQNAPRISTPIVSMTVGFDGTAEGDFLVRGRHCHGSLWWDAADNRQAGLNPGIGFNPGSQKRVTIAGDDEGRAVVCFARNVSAAAESAYVVFGLPEEEPTPVPADDVHRIFCLGQKSNSYSGMSLAAHPIANSSNALNAGSTFGFTGQPVSCTTGCWTYVTGSGANQSQFFDATAGDTPWLGATELVTVGLFAGTWHTTSPAAGSFITPLEPRLMGIVPYLRQGRSNFGEFTLSTDPGRSWQHMRNGNYMMWGGPAVIP